MHVWHMGVFKIFWNKAVFGCRKTFSGKYIFSGNANFRKRKIFPYVWLHFKKFSEKYFLMFGKEEGKDKPKKNIINDRDPRSRSRRRDLAINGASSRRRDLSIDASRDRTGAISRSMRHEIASLIAISVEGKIAINCAISRWREIAPSIARSRSRAVRRTGDRRHAHGRSLSLSLFPEMLWSENEGRKLFPGQRWKYWSIGSHFPENIIFRDSQTCGKRWKWFPKINFTQNKRTQSCKIASRVL